MGADKPQPLKPETQTPKLIFLLFLGCTLLLLVALSQNSVFERGKGEPKLNPKEQAKLRKRLKEIDDSEQYALIAKGNGWYPCLHSGRTSYYLKANEVWKYGVTSKGEFGRYTAKFLVSNNVSYDIQFKGNYSECLKQEQVKLFNYRYLPENLARLLAERLPRPPYNPVMR